MSPAPVPLQLLPAVLSPASNCAASPAHTRWATQRGCQCHVHLLLLLLQAYWQTGLGRCTAVSAGLDNVGAPACAVVVDVAAREHVQDRAPAHVQLRRAAAAVPFPLPAAAVAAVLLLCLLLLAVAAAGGHAPPCCNPGKAQRDTHQHETHWAHHFVLGVLLCCAAGGRGGGSPSPKEKSW